jgi:hypothetical protein
MDRRNFEHVVAADVPAATWLRFRRLSSPTLCRTIIQKRAPDLPDEALVKKGDDVAFAARSALGYWESDAPTLNARVLTRYYALLQASIAEQVASPDPDATLDAVQRHTELGHGFAAVGSSEGDFPHNYYVFPMRAGHFASYAKSRGIDLSGFALHRRPRTWASLSEADRSKGLSLKELFLRVPELALVATECLEGRALSFQLGLADRSFPRMNLWRKREPEAASTTTTTYAALHVDPAHASAEWLSSLKLPFRDFQPEHDSHTNTDHWVAALDHPSVGVWWDHLEHYKSDYCGTCVIAPFWGTTDVMCLHLATLYGLSIVVRYLPSLWHQVEYGRLDHVRVLIENYLSVLDRVGPGLVLDRITGVHLVVTAPGTLGAPI